jgi:hypothetical protein
MMASNVHVEREIAVPLSLMFKANRSSETNNENDDSESIERNQRDGGLMRNTMISNIRDRCRQLLIVNDSSLGKTFIE